MLFRTILFGISAELVTLVADIINYTANHLKNAAGKKVIEKTGFIYGFAI